MLPAATLPADAPEMPAAPAPDACLNCEGPLLPGAGYCPHCGQPRPHRLSVDHVAHELLHVFTHADKSIFGYAGQVLLHPGRVVADYLAGRRKRYFNPFQFLLLLVGFVAIITAWAHYYEGTSHGLQQRLQGHVSAAQLARVGTYFHYVGKYQNLWWLLLLLPVYALLTWLVMGRRRLNYAEAFLAFAVVGSAYHLYWLVIILGLWLVHGPIEGISNLASLVQVVAILMYLVLVGRRALRLSWGGALWRSALIVLLGAAFSAGVNYLAFRLYVFG